MESPLPPSLPIVNVADNVGSDDSNGGVTLATRKRPSSSSAAATEKEEEKAADGESEKKRRRAVAAAAAAGGGDFREVIGTLIRTMHLNIMTVSAQSISEPFNDNRLPPSPPPSSSSFTTLLPIDDTLQRMREIALSDAIPWKTFWSDVYVGMCATVHYFNVPDETHSNQQHLYLFSPTRLESITDRFATEYNLSAATRQHPCRIHAASFLPSFESKSSILNDAAAARDHNDKVYEVMWCQMSDVASTCIDIVCEALEIHAKRTSARAGEYDELCECIRLAYETAMLRGHVLLAAPLSQFAPLRIVQILNDREMYRIQLACKRYGSLFQTTIAPSLIAALHYTTLIRGLRPAELWPFENEPLWPKFIAVLAGLVSRYFVTGLRNGALQHSAANEGERDRRRRANYANEYKAKSNCLMTRDIHERADSEEIRHLEKYLDLVHKRKTCWNGGGGGGGGALGAISIVRPIWNLYHDDDGENRLHLLSRKIFVPRLCYSCDDYCLVSKIRFRDYAMLEYDGDDDHDDDDHDDEEERRVSNPRVAAAAALAAPPPLQPVQGDIVSSTTNSGLERIRQRREHCVLSNIVKNNDDQYAPEDKVALTNGDFCNLLTLSAPSIHHDALLAYQAFGLRKFPRQYDLGVHLDISRYLFATHATRFVGAAAKQRHCSYSRFVARSCHFEQ